MRRCFIFSVPLRNGRRAAGLSDHQTCGFRQTEHQVHVLNGGSGSAFSEVVEARSEYQPLFVAPNRDLHRIFAGIGSGGKKSRLIGIVLQKNKSVLVISAVNILDTGELQDLLGDGSSDDTSTTRSGAM